MTNPKTILLANVQACFVDCHRYLQRSIGLALSVPATALLVTSDSANSTSVVVPVVSLPVDYRLATGILVAFGFAYLQFAAFAAGRAREIVKRLRKLEDAESVAVIDAALTYPSLLTYRHDGYRRSIAALPGVVVSLTFLIWRLNVGSPSPGWIGAAAVLIMILHSGLLYETWKPLGKAGLVEKIETVVDQMQSFASDKTPK